MRTLADVQAEFAAALRDPAVTLPAGLVGPDRQPAPRRFAVYRNNVIVGMVNALRSSFPVIERIVGEDFFEAMARAYALAEPPSSPVLMDYGASFADFIAGFRRRPRLPTCPMSPASSGHGARPIMPPMRSRWPPRISLPSAPTRSPASGSASTPRSGCCARRSRHRPSGR